MGPTDNKPYVPNNEKHIGSSAINTVSPEQGTAGQESSSPSVILPTPPVSLTSSESFSSNDSGHSVVVNSVDWKKVYSRSNEQMGPTDNKPYVPNNEKHIGSSAINTVSPEQGTAGQESSSPPVILPTPPVSLTSSESFSSNDSDHSVVVNSVDWPSQDDLYKKGIMSSSSVETFEQLNDQKENLKLENNGLAIGNLENSNYSDANDDSSGRKYDYSDEEKETSYTFDIGDEIWDPPESENKGDDQDMAILDDDDDKQEDNDEDDNSENSMVVATLDDDKDGSANGNRTKLTKPSSPSSSNEGVSSSHRFEDEREKLIKEMTNGKFKNLVSQLLQKFGAYNCQSKDESWVNIIPELAWQAASLVKPDTTESKTIDPANYVKVKCIATGSCSDSQLIEGLVFKKHAAHKHMATKYENPRLLLIQGMLAPSSISSGLTSFNSMISKVPDVKMIPEDINGLITNLKACRPNVILVEKSTSRDVSDKLVDLKLTLVLDMKLHRLKRIESCTGSPIQSSVAPLNPKLKGCKSLYFEKFMEEHGGKKPSKTLMFLEGCPKRYGCTILLKGSSIEELKKIKCVTQCAVLMAYNFILETSFLLDKKTMFSTIAFRETVANSLSAIHSPTSIPLNDGGASTEGDPVLIPSVNNEELSDVQVSTPCQETAFKNAIAEVSYASPQTFQMMATYIDLDGRKPKAPNAGSPASPAKDKFDEGTVEKGSSLGNAQHDDHSQSSCADNDTRQYDDNEAYIQSKDEINSVLDSESILVLMSRRNASRGTICEQSHLSHIKFYRNPDNPLGKFLRDNLFNQSIPCEACGEPREAHFYFYTHHNKQLTIQVKRLPDKKLPRESEGKLWMWSRCGKCEPDKEKVTKRVLISTAASGLSFGKFLELSFSSQSSFNIPSNCGHSLQKDFLYFFGLGSMVAMFRYSRVATYTISVPPQKLKFHSSITEHRLQDEIDTVRDKRLLLFAEISGYLKKIDSQFSASNLVLNVSDIEEILKLEQSEFEENIKNLGSKDENSQNTGHILLKLNQLRWETLLEARVWIRRLHLLLSSSSKSSNAIATNGVVEKGTPSKENIGVVGKAKEGPQKASEKGVHQQTILEENESREEFEEIENVAHEAVEGKIDIGVEGKRSSSEQVSEEAVIEVDVKVETVAGEDKLYVKGPPFERMLQGGEAHDLMSLLITEGIDPFPSIQLSKDSESMPPYLGSIDTGHKTDDILLSGNESEDGSISITSNPPTHKDVPEILSFLASLFSDDSNGWVWKPFGKIREECMMDLQDGLVHKFEPLPSNGQLHSQELLPTLSQVIIEEGWRLHIPLNDGNCVVSDYDSEISSFVACALASWENPKRDENDSLQRSVTVPSDSSSKLSFDLDLVRTGSTLHNAEFLVSDVHPEVNLGSRKYPPKGKYSVVILYADEFYDLRKDFCPSELDFIASLSRCKSWDAKGGKSKAMFAKTLDDRLIIKEIKKTEYESFMEFSTKYFDYMKQSFKVGNQTCLAKILGIYQVTIRNSKTGKETKHDIMVQENLTFGRNIGRQYDLKGALHARLVTDDGTGDVLLDQNFVNDMSSSPLYVGQKAKRLLQRAVWNDTTFLNSINVMDYSLLVGVDRQRRELVCGIIDYIRQFTWDKQVENWVKTSLVVPKNMLPTIVSPREYKKRFRKFMDTHFLVVPDNWCSHRSSNPCKLCGITSGDSSPVIPTKPNEDLNHS